MKKILGGALAAALAVLAAGCGSSGTTGSNGPGSSGAGNGGNVSVLYAGSLVDLMQKQAGPAFAKATPYSIDGISGTSGDLAKEIAGKVHAGDVYISASPTTTASLMGKKGGGWVPWYATFATSPVVLGYNPKSPLARIMKTEPWWKILATRELRLGRTDPVTDPKGVLSVQALKDAAAKHPVPEVRALANDNGSVFPEETLVGRLQSGQLDAGFFYKSEAVAAHIPYVPLTGEHLDATYTVNVLDHAPNPKAAAAFVAWLLGPRGRAILTKDGFTVLPQPKVTGSGVPASLRKVLARR